METDAPQGAAVLDNFFPTATTAILRRGKSIYATLGDGENDVKSLFTYSNGNNRKMFGATNDTVYDITSVLNPVNWRIVDDKGNLIVTQDGDYFGMNSTDGLDVWTGASGGNWITVQFATTGGVFLIGVNGSSGGFIYDGEEFYSLDGGNPLYPGVKWPDDLTSSDMSYVWVYKNRLWFAQKDSLDIWYMDDPDSIGGDAKIYPMGGILTMGGSISWGEPWSMSTSSAGGLSEQMVVTSTEGEVAVFQGSYPDSTAEWLHVGTYRIGRPLGNKAHFRGGGDIAVATSVGLVPLSKAISLDVTALSPAAVSYNIQDAWQSAVDTRGLQDWVCMLWPERKMAIMSPPTTIGSYDPILLVSNSETGAWCRFTNWDARAMCVFNGEMYFGGREGEVFRANVTGNDNGQAFTGVYIPLFDDLGSPANIKIPKMGRGVARSAGSLSYKIDFKSDFDIDSGAAPSASSIDGGTTWGSDSKWGEGAVWGGTNPTVFNAQWKSLGGTGYYVSACYQVTSGSSAPIDVEIVHIEISFTMGEVLS